MRKNEISKADNSELIVDYVISFSSLISNYNTNRGIKQLEAHCTDLEKEIVKRGILTEEQIKRINL